VLSDLTLGVPLDHAKPDGEQIELFAMEIVAADMPWLLFLQGGTGMAGPPPRRPAQLARPCPEPLPRAAAGPARYRRVLPRHPAVSSQPRQCGPPGRLPGAVPR